MSTEEFAGADSGILKRTAKKGVFGTRPLLGSKFFYRGEGVNDLRNDCVVFLVKFLGKRHLTFSIFTFMTPKGSAIYVHPKSPPIEQDYENAQTHTKTYTKLTIRRI